MFIRPWYFWVVSNMMGAKSSRSNVPAQGNRGRRAWNSAPRSTARGGGFHGHGGTPNSWIIYLLENPTQVDKRERERCGHNVAWERNGALLIWCNRWTRLCVSTCPGCVRCWSWRLDAVSFLWQPVDDGASSQVFREISSNLFLNQVSRFSRWSLGRFLKDVTLLRLSAFQRRTDPILCSSALSGHGQAKAIFSLISRNLSPVYCLSH